MFQCIKWAMVAIAIVPFFVPQSYAQPSEDGPAAGNKRSAIDEMTSQNQTVEVRTYYLKDKESEATLDRYLESALVPALKRQGLGPIGVLDQASEPESGEGIEVKLLIVGPSLAAVLEANRALAEDKDYQAAAAEYLSIPADKPILRRISSELLHSFNCWPTVKVPEQAAKNAARLFELRVYESPTEQLGELKVEMFNSGEVPIFLDCGVIPVFMGQALIGDLMPNLTYMTVYDNAAARDEAWTKFKSHPDWKQLSGLERYKGTVSKVHKSDWIPKSYSDL